MKLRILCVRIILFTCLCIVSVVASAATVHSKHSDVRKTSMVSDAPLIIFQSIDKRLTLIDSDNRKLQASAHSIQTVRSVPRQRRFVRELQHSNQERDRLLRMNQLLAISSRAERRYRNQHQAYGATLFRDLHLKLSSARTALLRAQRASTVPAWSREEKVVNARMLSVITQYQAISGGYVGLACRPGSWACCQPKTEANGKVTVRGCTWSCASKLAACRGGCLGRRTPSTVVAVRIRPKPPIFAPSPSLASKHIATSNQKQHVHVPATAQGSASGR